MAELGRYIDAQGNIIEYDVQSGQVVDTTPQAGPSDGQPPAPGPEPVKEIEVGSSWGGSTKAINPEWSRWKATSDAWAASVAPPPAAVDAQGAGPAGAPAGSPAGGGGGLNPADPQYWLALGDAPPWTKAGFADFASWSASLGEQRAAAALKAAGGSGATGASAAVSRQNNIDSAALAREQDAQAQANWQETYNYNKAANDQKVAQNAAQLEKSKGDTLLGLGTRPDTLIKYLYALKGQQTPQAIGGTTANLPGYQNVIGQPNPGGAGVGGGTSSPSPAPGTASLNLPPQDFSGAYPGHATGQQVPLPTAAQVGFQSPSVAQGVNGVDQTNAFNATANGNTLANAPTLGAPTPFGTTMNNNGQTSTSGVNLPMGTRLLNGQIFGPQIAPQLPDQIQALREQTIAGMTPEQRRLAEESAGNANDRMNGYAQGGLIPERVIGVGQDSGQKYEFGEEGTEAVVSNDMLERLMQVAGKVDFNQKSPDGKSQRFSFTLNGPPKKKRDLQGNAIADEGQIMDMPEMTGGDDFIGDMANPGRRSQRPFWLGRDQSNPVRSYASGGTIGYDPSNVPSLGSQSSGFFNNPYLKDVVARGYNSSPATPLFPQIGIATGGGQSLIPSMQRLNSLLPSEQSLYAGALQDEFGANAQDAFSLSKQLAPGATGLRTPKFAN